MTNVVRLPEKHKIEQEAAEWLVRLDGDSALSKQQLDSLRQWLKQSPVHREQLRSLAGLWDKMNVLTELAVPLDRPRHRGHGERKVAAFGWLGKPHLAVAAATIIFGSIIGTLAWQTSKPVLDSNGHYTTSIGQQQSTLLSDGSTVLLNTNSHILVDYNQSFRDIYLLRGEVQFTVAKNANVPFRVFAGFGRIQALGTVFSVHRFDDSVDVVVTEGRVALASLARSRPLPAANARPPDAEPRTVQVNDLDVLAAGQVATIWGRVEGESNQVSASANLRSIEKADLSKRLSWTQGVLIFSGEPLIEVVREIGRYTEVSIEITDPAVRAIRIGGRFPVGETEKMFDALETNFGLQVTRLDLNRVLVSADIQQ